MRYRMFKERFVEPIRAGTKRLTIRETPGGIKPGDVISLRRWTGAPYRSKQEVIRPPVRVEAVSSVLIGDGQSMPLVVVLGGAHLNRRDLDRLAVADGFSSAEEMAAYWRDRLPFDGWAIHWEVPA